jgi:DNA (cytosine-5)-methyltransferase 1
VKNYIDLFCGAGGLGEGFSQAGFSPLYCIDNDHWSLETCKLRKIYWFLSERGKCDLYYDFIKNSSAGFAVEYLTDSDQELRNYTDTIMSGNELSVDTMNLVMEEIENSMIVNNFSQVDVVTGGPPCQAYSFAGRSRLRSPVYAKNEALIRQHREDSRHHLYETYLNLVQKISPKVFVYENVPGLVTARSVKGRVIRLMMRDFSEMNPQYKIIPLNRQIGLQLNLIHDNSEDVKNYIVNAADYGVPQNRKRIIFIGIREDILSGGKINLHDFWESIDSYWSGVSPSVYDAISDLPFRRHGTGDDYFSNNHYRTGRPSKYAQRLREREIKGILNHFARKHWSKDLERYRWCAKYAQKKYRSPTLNDLPDDLKPDHKNQKSFIDRFKVQMADRPASTVTAHISKDGHYFIHYDPEQNRSLTVREAARLQSFDDSYAFCGPRTHQFRQVGNAVPPLLSRVIAEGIKTILAAI